VDPEDAADEVEIEEQPDHELAEPVEPVAMEDKAEEMETAVEPYGKTCGCC